jgi:hypothetical protein
MAKPKLTSGKRDASVRVYLTEEEKGKIEHKAGAVGLSVAAYLRALALADIARPEPQTMPV